MERILELLERWSWLRTAVLVAVALLVGVGIGLAPRWRSSGGGGATSQPVEVRAVGTGSGREASPGGRAGPAVLVDVSGAVRRPGVYELAEGARVLDALRAAGGAAADADLTAVNRAAQVVDGQQVVVPAEVQAVAGGATAASPGGAGTPAGPVTGQRVSLNSADAAALDALPGVGPVTAQRIVEDRLANGPFRTVEELDRVPGIGPGTVERLRDAVGP